MYTLLRCFSLCLARLSSASTDRLAHGLAFFLFDILHIRQRLVLSNLQRAFPAMSEAERKRIGRLSVYHFILTALEFLRSIRLDIAEDIDILGVEHIRKVLDREDSNRERSKGVYVVCCHMGSWEAMGAKVTRAIAPAYIVVKRVGSAGVNRFVEELREKNGFFGIKRQKKGDAYRAIKETLARNEVVGFVMDQARPGEPKLPFFGHPAKTNTSFAAIWKRLPAPIVPGFIRRVGVNRHVIEFLPEVHLPVSGDEAADVLQQSEHFNRVVEDIIRRCPEQYFWMHNRWK